MVGVIVVAATLAVAVLIGLLWRRRNGSMRRPRGDDVRLAGADLGAALGPRATLVQFSSAFCAPCRATRLILDSVCDAVDGVAHVEIDAESHLDLVRRLHVLRTPTVLVLDADGRVVKRASGQPRKVDVIAALGEVVNT
ncbi:MAG: thioredoxin [Streptosporangiales bacterium]|nr:thioredoxin [Streptosporangiales bacterium]